MLVLKLSVTHFGRTGETCAKEINASGPSCNVSYLSVMGQC